MPVNCRPFVASILVVGSVLACAQGIKLSEYPTTVSLYQAGVRELRARRWDNAIAVFDKLTLELPARDTLLPTSQFYLAQAYAGKGQHLLAAQSYYRLSESFATDSLADESLYRAGHQYQMLWRKPPLDPTYGVQAQQTYQLLLSLYPDSPWTDSATAQIAVLQEMFATKDYLTAMDYFRRKAWDSAIIYLRDVVDRYPKTEKVRDAYLRLAQTYDEINYRDDHAEVCKTLHEKYPDDHDVAAVCGPVVASPVDHAP